LPTALATKPVAFRLNVSPSPGNNSTQPRQNNRAQNRSQVCVDHLSLDGEACDVCEESSSQATRDTHDGVHLQVVALIGHHLSGQPARDQTIYDPKEQLHKFLLISIC
jgi:hypothetical protein